MCYFSLPGHRTIDGSPPTHMPPELLEKIARQVFPHARFLALSCGAESLMYPHFERYLEIVAEARIETTELITNGQLLTRKYSEGLVRAGISKLAVSIDAATAATYEDIRGGANFTRLLDNLQTLDRIKKELHSSTPSVRLQFVLFRSNIEELPAAIELAKKLEAESFTCMHMALIRGLNMDGETLFHHRELANEKMDEARATAERLGIALTCPPNFGHTPPEGTAPSAEIRCPFDPWRNLFITESGIAYPCGWLTKNTVAGKFDRQNFEEIWFGREYRRLRHEIETGNQRPQCKKCPATAGGSVDDENAFSER